MKVLVGKYVKTHGIKGEIKVRSNFLYKDRIFQTGKKVFLKDQEFTIKDYRKHQEYDMLTFEGINDINQILSLKGNFLYANREDLGLKKEEYLDSDLIGLDLYQNNIFVGKVRDIAFITKNKKLLVINSHYVPFELIKNVDLKNKRIDIEEVFGLL